MDLRELASRKAQERGLDAAFVDRLINQESRWNPTALSPVGARGLMQVMPATGRDLGVADPGALFDPEVSIDAGTRYLAQLSKRFDANPHLMAMAYNAGPGRVGKLVAQYDDSPAAIYPHLPAETRNYAVKVAGPIAGLSEMSAHKVLPRPAAELRTAPAKTLKERAYDLVSTQNEGLAPAKTWVGPDFGLPPEPSVTTGNLAGMGLLALGGVGAAMPAVGAALPSAFSISPARALGEMALSAAGEKAGAEVGEVLGGSVGRDYGAVAGGMLGLPRSGTALKSDIVGIPPTGILEGTRVLDREGMAKPVFHGTPAVFDELDVDRSANPERALFGPGLYFTTAAENVAEGYAAGHKFKNEKAYAQLMEKADQHARRAAIAKVQRDEAIRRLKVSPTYDERLSDSINRFEVKLFREQDKVREMQQQANRYKEKLDIFPESHAPNIRPTYLNIKKPFNIDKPLSAEQYRALAAALERKDAANADVPAWVQDQRDDVRDFISELKRSATDVESYPGLSNTSGELVYRSLENILGSRVETNKLLQDAGFDGITHLGGGRFTGGPHKPMRHRVYIAFDNKQVVPYFNPKFAATQTELERKKEIRRIIAKMRKASRNEAIQEP